MEVGSFFTLWVSFNITQNYFRQSAQDISSIAINMFCIIIRFLILSFSIESLDEFQILCDFFNSWYNTYMLRSGSFVPLEVVCNIRYPVQKQIEELCVILW